MTSGTQREPMKVSETTQKLLDLLHDKKWVNRFLTAKGKEDRVALLGAYPVQDQKEEGALQYLIDRLSPPRPSVNFESLIRAEKEKEEETGKSIQTPQEEQAWQDKIDEAIAKDKEHQKTILMAHFESIKQVLPEITFEELYPSITPITKTNAKKVELKPVENTLAGPPQKLDENILQLPNGVKVDSLIGELKLGQMANDKLQAQGILTVGQYFSLTIDQATGILQTPLIPARHKQFFRTTPIVPKI